MANYSISFSTSYLLLSTNVPQSADDYCGVELNLEVCKSVLELTDKLEEAQTDRVSLQAKISTLENTVTSLSSQLQKATTTKVKKYSHFIMSAFMYNTIFLRAQGSLAFPVTGAQHL